MTQSKLAKLLADIDTGAPDRWFKVEVVKGQSSKPIKVTLMESQRPGFNLSSALTFTRCNASEAEVILAAETLVVMIGDYAKVIGEYPAKNGGVRS